MTQKEDLRIKKTKSALFTAFFSMLETMTFEDITVNALCEKADVRRATFYKHYADKLDFLKAVTRMLRDHFDSFRWKPSARQTEADYYVAYAKRIVGFINEHEAVVDNLLRSNLLHSIINVVTEQNYLDTAERLRKSQELGMRLKASPEVIAMMCAGGVAEIIHRWVSTGRKKDVNILADEIGILVSLLI